MAIKHKPENTIEFSDKGITIYLTKAIYDAIEKVAGSSPAFGSKKKRESIFVLSLFSLNQSFGNHIRPPHTKVPQRALVGYSSNLCLVI